MNILLVKPYWPYPYSKGEHTYNRIWPPLCLANCAAILEKDNAVEDFRTLIGATNPGNAAEGTIRKIFATSIEANAVHGSDSDENAAIEGNFYFSQLERVI